MSCPNGIRTIRSHMPEVALTAPIINNAISTEGISLSQETCHCRIFESASFLCAATILNQGRNYKCPKAQKKEICKSLRTLICLKGILKF